MPNYSLSVDQQHDMVILTVHQGPDVPYYYKNKAYKRNDSSTVEVTGIELNRLILKGNNMDFVDLESKNQDLSFKHFEASLSSNMNLKNAFEAAFITLGIISNDAYTIAAELLADKNSYPGIDIARFDADPLNILYRATYEHESILQELEVAISEFTKFYVYERIDGLFRSKVEKILIVAFREI